MKIINFLARLCLVIIISVNSFKYIYPTQTDIDTFSRKLSKLEKSTISIVGNRIPRSLTHSHYSAHVAIVMAVFGFVILFFSTLTLFASNKYTFCLGFLYFFEQLVIHNFVEIYEINRFDKLEQFLLTSLIFLTTLLLSC